MAAPVPSPNAWEGVQDVAYHLERAVTKSVNALMLAGAGLHPQSRTVLREAGDWVQMARRGVEGLGAKTKSRKAAREAALKALKSAEKEGVAAAALLFQETVPVKSVPDLCTHLANAVRHTVTALEVLVARMAK